MRVVCANTLAAALGAGDGLAVIRHTSGMGEALATARNVLTRQIELRRFAITKVISFAGSSTRLIS